MPKIGDFRIIKMVDETRILYVVQQYRHGIDLKGCVHETWRDQAALDTLQDAKANLDARLAGANVYYPPDYKEEKL